VLLAHAEVADFGRVSYDQGALRAAGRWRLVHGDDDPYCPEGAGQACTDLGLGRQDVDVVVGGGHLDPDAGYGWWPSVRDWCLDPATRLRGR